MPNLPQDFACLVDFKKYYILDLGCQSSSDGRMPQEFVQLWEVLGSSHSFCLHNPAIAFAKLFILLLLF